MIHDKHLATQTCCGPSPGSAAPTNNPFHGLTDLSRQARKGSGRRATRLLMLAFLPWSTTPPAVARPQEFLIKLA